MGISQNYYYPIDQFLNHLKDLFYHSFLAPQCNSTRTDEDLAVRGSDFYFYEDPILVGQRMN